MLGKQPIKVSLKIFMEKSQVNKTHYIQHGKMQIPTKNWRLMKWQILKFRQW